MKVEVKKNDDIILLRNDVIGVVDKGGAYELLYEDNTAQAVYKNEDVTLELH